MRDPLGADPPVAGSPPRRILFTVHHVGPGGMEQQMLHLARGLLARGDQVTIGFLNPDAKDDIAEVERRGARVVALGSRKRHARVTSVSAAVRALARDCDLVHCTGWDASLWGRLGAVAAGRPAVVTEHALDRRRQVSAAGGSRARLIAWHNRLLAPWTYAMVAVAESQVDLLRDEGVPRSKISVIPNGVPLRARRDGSRDAPTRASLGIPDGALVVLQIARFHPLKRQDLTYDAVRASRRRLGDVHLLFAGYHSDFQRALAKRIDDDGSDWVHFLGVRSDIPGLLALSDLAVLPSEAEALPMAVLEAMAMGVPQVVTDVGDMGAVVRRTGAGLVVAPKDGAALEEACQRVLSDRELARELGSRALAAANEFDVETMIDRYAALFDAAIASARRGGAARGLSRVRSLLG